MKSLSNEKMELVQGGDGCSTTANVLGTIAFGFTMAALFVNPVTAPLAATLVATQGAVFGGVSLGVGWMC
jgi:hypothetical protein